MDRNMYEANWIRAYNNSVGQARAMIMSDFLTYPKNTSNAMHEVRERGYNPDGGRLQRWVDSLPDDERPPRGTGRGMTLLWERRHIDAFVEHLESIEAFTAEEKMLRKFQITREQISVAVQDATIRAQSDGIAVGGVYGVFWCDGVLAAIPLDRKFVTLPDRPLGVFLTTYSVLDENVKDADRQIGIETYRALWAAQVSGAGGVQ